MGVANDHLIRQLTEERDALLERVAAIESAVEALTGTRPSSGSTRVLVGKSGVGDDKLDAIRKYIRRHGTVRQADITRELGFNSGTVSTGLHALMVAGEVERGPKADRSITWRAL